MPKPSARMRSSVSMRHLLLRRQTDPHNITLGGSVWEQIKTEDIGMTLLNKEGKRWDGTSWRVGAASKLRRGLLLEQTPRRRLPTRPEGRARTEPALRNRTRSGRCSLSANIKCGDDPSGPAKRTLQGECLASRAVRRKTSASLYILTRTLPVF